MTLPPLVIYLMELAKIALHDKRRRPLPTGAFVVSGTFGDGHEVELPIQPDGRLVGSLDL
jgi:hypothetical protein